MELVSKEFFVSHSQICVFNPGIDVPFNDWTERHVAQGFTWRPGSVSFGTVDDGGSYRLTVCWEKALLMREDSALVIRVPWLVGNEAAVIIANICGDETPLEMATGSYQLQYECSPFSYQVEYEAELYAAADVHSLETAMTSVELRQFIRLSFAPDPSPVFEIVRADGIKVTRSDDLLLTASPAI